MKRLSQTAIMFALVLVSSVGNAQSASHQTGDYPAQRFGEQGQLAISSDAALSIRNTSISDGGSTLTLELAPAFDYFVVNGFSVGGFVSLDYTKSGDNHATRFGIGPRVGYNFTLSDLLSLWPKVGFSYAHTSVTGAIAITNDATIETTTSGNALALNLFVPLMLHPATHFFAGFGPFLDTDVTGDHKATVVGGKLTLGGWLD
jgi:hypothetical protein